MNAETIFSACSMIVIPGWLLLVILPRWKYSATLISGLIIPAVLGFVYAWLIVSYMGSSEGSFDSLAGVRELFGNDFLLLAGWIHYLAFDLFIGSWEVRDAQRHRVHHLAVVPCLFLTFVVGPVGLLVYLAVRMGWKRQYLLDHAG